MRHEDTAHICYVALHALKIRSILYDKKTRTFNAGFF
jgi:hypothetical protein